jgi:muramidase (phage lysozyme)
MTRDELLAISREANVRAMLDAIAACEGTAGRDGYRTQFGDGLFDSFADHPKQVIERTLNGKPIASSAAGRYQFLARTWAALVVRYGFPSFAPEWQDAGAVALIDGRGALEDVRAGRLDAAVAKLNREWASLPGAPYGQPTRHPTFVRDIFVRAGGTLADAPAVEQPEPTPPVTTEARPMAPLVPALLGILSSVAPELIRIFGDKDRPVAERNVEAGLKAIEIARDIATIGSPAAPRPGPAAAVEQIASDPALAQQFRDAVQRRWYELTEAPGGGIEGARKVALDLTAGTDWRSIGYGVTIALLALMIVGGGGFMLWSLIHDPATTPEQRGMLIGALIALISSPVAFFFGSSVSSRAKDSALVSKLGKR